MRNWILSNTGVSIDNTVKNSGSSSIKFTGTGNIRQVVVLESNRPFNISGHVYPIGGSTLWISIYELGDNDPNDENYQTNLTLIARQPYDVANFTPNAWTRVDFTFNTPVQSSAYTYYLVAFECSAYSSPFYLDDVMLVRGEFPVPYIENPTDYFYGSEILTELPASDINAYVVPKEAFRQDFDNGGRWYARLGLQIDPSQDVYMVSDNDYDSTYTYSNGSPPTGNVIVNDSLSSDFWRHYGDTRIVYMPVGFDPTTALNKKAYFYFKSSATVVINGSLLAEGSLNADRLNVFELSAISANLGTVTSGILKSPNYGATEGSYIDLTNSEIILGGSSDPIFHYYYNGSNWEIIYKGIIDSNSSDISDTLKEQLGSKYVKITASDAYFTYDPETDAITPSSITLTANPSPAIASPSYVWKDNAGQVISGATTSTLVVNSSDFTNTDLLTYTVEVTDTSSSTNTVFSDTYTLVKIKHGRTGKVFNISPDSTFFVVDPNKDNTVTPTSITISATKTNITGTVTWYTSTNQVQWTNVGTGDQLVINNTNVTDKLYIKAEVTDSVSGAVFTDYETVYKVKEGDNAVIAYLTNDAHVVSTDSAGNNPDLTGATTQILAKRGSVDLTFQSGGGTPSSKNNYTIGTPTYSGLSGTLSNNTFTATSLSANVGTATFPVKYLDANNTVQTINVVFTVAKAKAGNTAVIRQLKSEHAIFKKSPPDYVIPNPVTIELQEITGSSVGAPTIPLKIVPGAGNTTDFIVDGAAISVPAGTSSVAIDLSTLGLGWKYYRFKLTSDDGATIYDSEIVPTIRDGEIIIDATNDTLVIPTDANRQNADLTYAYTNINIYESKDGAITDITTTKYNAPTINPPSGITATWNSTQKRLTIDTFTPSTDTGNIVVTFNPSPGNENYPTQVIYIYWVAAKAGVPGTGAKISYLDFSANKVVKTTAGTVVSLSPTSITAYAKILDSDTGAVSALTSGYINWYTSTDLINWGTPVKTTTLSATTTSSTYSSIPTNIKGIKAVLTDLSNNVLDSEVIPVLEEGSDAISIDLTNDSILLPADSNGAITSYSNASTTVTVYEGATDVTNNYTISVSSTNPTGITTSVSSNTVYITGGIPNNVDSGYIIIQATRTNYPTLTVKWFWSKAKAGLPGPQGPEGPAIQILSSGYFFVPRSVTSASGAGGPFSDFNNIDSYNPTYGGVNQITLELQLASGVTFDGWYVVGGSLTYDTTSYTAGQRFSTSTGTKTIYAANPGTTAYYITNGYDYVTIEARGTQNGVPVKDKITLFKRTTRTGYFLSEDGSFFGSIQWVSASGREFKYNMTDYNTWSDTAAPGFYLGVSSSDSTAYFTVGRNNQYIQFNGTEFIVHNVNMRSGKTSVTDNTNAGYYLSSDGQLLIGNNTNHIKFDGTSFELQTPVYIVDSAGQFLSTIGLELKSTDTGIQYPNISNFNTDGKIRSYMWDSTTSKYKDIVVMGLSTDFELFESKLRVGTSVYLPNTDDPEYGKIGVNIKSTGAFGLYLSTWYYTGIHSYAYNDTTDETMQAIYGFGNKAMGLRIDVSLAPAALIVGQPSSTYVLGIAGENGIRFTGRPGHLGTNTGFLSPELLPYTKAYLIHYNTLDGTYTRYSTFLLQSIIDETQSNVDDKTYPFAPLVPAYPLVIKYDSGIANYTIISDETFGFTAEKYADGVVQINHPTWFRMHCIFTGAIIHNNYSDKGISVRWDLSDETKTVIQIDSNVSVAGLLIPVQGSRGWVNVIKL